MDRFEVTTHKRRKFARLPVYIVDDHNDVLQYIYRAIGSRHLPLNNNSLIHFDSHPDLLIDKHLKETDVWNKQQLFEQLSIENWILPGCYTGQFSKVFWIKPSWSNQISDGFYQIPIGKYKDSVRVGSDLYYFLSDGIFVDKKELVNERIFELHVSTVPPAASITDERIGSDVGFILDIDLDFFSCRNPFRDLYGKGKLYEKVARLFNFDVAESDFYSKSVKCSKRRQKQLKLLEAVFKHFDQYGTLEGFSFELPDDVKSQLMEIVEIIEQHYKKSDFDWLILFNAGMTCDQSELPHHVSSPDELVDMYRVFESCLAQINTKSSPILITIAKSSLDDYCPSEQVESILCNVLRILRKLYEDIEIFDYCTS